METVRYLIVGGGMTGDAAVKGIREHDARRVDRPRRRRAASAVRAAAAHQGSLVGVATRRRSGAARRMPEPCCGSAAASSRSTSTRHRATDDRGEEYGWEKLLLATGGRPRTIPGTDGVVYYRTLDDYRAVRARAHGARAPS